MRVPDEEIRVREEVGVHLEQGALLEDEGRQHDLGQVHPDAHLRQQVADDAPVLVQRSH